LGCGPEWSAGFRWIARNSASRNHDTASQPGHTASGDCHSTGQSCDTAGGERNSPNHPTESKCPGIELTGYSDSGKQLTALDDNAELAEQSGEFAEWITVRSSARYAWGIKRFIKWSSEWLFVKLEFAEFNNALESRKQPRQ